MSDDDDDDVTLTWKAPPEHAYFAGGGTAGRYRKVASALKAHAGQWAVLPGKSTTNGGAKATAQNVRAGKVKGFEPKGAFEAAVDGLTIYVRYVGSRAEQAAREAAEQAHAEPDGDHGAELNGQRPTPADVEPVDGPAIRAWGRRNGYQVPERGRLSSALVEAYRKFVAEQDARAGLSD